jgi:hypothetical protein
MSCVPCLSPPDSACCPDWDGLDPVLQGRALDLAWASMRYLTGGRVGSCPVALRPCAPEPCGPCSGGWLSPRIVGGQWYNAYCGGRGCSCSPLSEVLLPGPVAEVLEVRVDGVSLDPSAYRLDDGRGLVRVDGGAWPACQDMAGGPSDPGTFFIDYVPGVPLTPAAAWAAGTLACEFAKACSGGKCRLPSSVTSLTRQGVTMQFDDSMFSNGMTGIREVDAYLLSVNPHRLKVPPRVWSPDIPQGRLMDAAW